MGTYAPILPIGGNGGNDYKCFDTDGKVLEKIGVWCGGWQIRGIQLWRTGENGQMFGSSEGKYHEFEFKPGERITKCSLWGNGAGTRLGKIYFETNQQRNFSAQMTDWGTKKEYPIDIGSGICVGMWLDSGSDIDNAAFVFLNKIRSVTLTNVHYPTLNFDTRGITPQTLDTFQDSNTTGSPRNWKFGSKTSKTTSHTWSVTTGVEAYAELSVEAGIPEVAKVGGKFGWKVSESGTHGRTNQETRELSWEESGTLQPGESIDLQAVTRVGKLASIDYTGTMVVTMEDGKNTFEYPIKGTYDGVDCTAVEVVDSGTGQPVGAEVEAVPPQPREAPVSEVHPV